MTTLSKEDVVRWADECVFDIMQADEHHAENEVIDSGNRWITDKMMAFATLSRADLVAENERLKLVQESALKVCAQIDEVVCALPLDYLDLPDGGDVSLGEQVSRMYSEVKNLRHECVATRTALAAAIAREIGVMKLMAEVESKYFSLLKEQDAEAEQFKAEGDMYGWNFHTGLRSGAVQMHLNMTTLIKAVAQPRDDSALREMIAGVYAECAKACRKEAVVIVVDGKEERAYNNAVSDCGRAIRALAKKARHGS